MFVFDDILALSLAREVAVRMLVKHHCNPLFLNYCQKEKLCDYITANPGSTGAVREIVELALNAMRLFEKTLEGRVAFSGTYSDYLASRQKIKTEILESRDGSFHL